MIKVTRAMINAAHKVTLANHEIALSAAMLTKIYTAMSDVAERDIAAVEREACADKAGEFARKWWSIHCDSNKHMETTRKAHDDFCALQAAIRARGQA